jgi:phosphonate transport system substrate-binding protein
MNAIMSRVSVGGRLRLAILAFGLALGAAPGTAQRAPAPFVVALKPDKDPDAMLAERQGLAAMLTAELQRPVQVIVPLSGAVIVEGLANGTIDVAYVSATDMLNARRSGAATLLLAGEIEGRTWYRSYWVALADKPYASVADLRGLPIAFASRTSTSGYVIPLHDLHRRGLMAAGGSPEDFFGRDHVGFGSGYVSAVERVLRGEAEAAAVSDYVLDQDKHLTAEQRARLKKVAEQGPVPTHVLAAGRRVSDADQDRLRQALLSLNRPEHDALRQRAFVSRLVEVDETEHLQPLVEALALVQSTR